MGLVGLYAAVLVGAVAAQDQEQPAFRAEVQIALHSVAVLDPEGEPVQGLGRDDFTIYEADEPQEITVFLSPDDSPLDVATVIDSSASLSFDARQVRLAARSFFGQMDPLDCVYLLPFNDEIGPGQWDRGLLMPGRTDGIFMRGGTALYDALIHGMGVLNRTITTTPSTTGCGKPITVEDSGRPDRRRAVVLLSDGADENSQARYDEVLDVADATAIPIFPVLHGDAHRNDRLRMLLERMASETGGATVEARRAVELQRALGDTLVLLRASYLIGYLPPEGDEREQERGIRIRSRPGFRLIYRPSYWR